MIVLVHQHDGPIAVHGHTDGQDSVFAWAVNEHRAWPMTEDRADWIMSNLPGNNTDIIDRQ